MTRGVDRDFYRSYRQSGQIRYYLIASARLDNQRYYRDRRDRRLLLTAYLEGTAGTEHQTPLIIESFDTRIYTP
jgi:hypothetical protein